MFFVYRQVKFNAKDFRLSIMFFFIHTILFLFYFFLLGLLLEQGCPCLGALLALYVYVPVCTCYFCVTNKLDWIGHCVTSAGYILNKKNVMVTTQWRNTHWTRLDKCQGPPGSSGLQA